MAVGQTLSLLGLYNYDPTLFDGLQLPDGIDKDTIISGLILETAELEVIYPDIDVCKTAIETYSAMRLHAWQNMYNVLYRKDYDPFTNVERHEERTVTQKRDLDASGSGNMGVAAYNESGYTDREKTETANKEAENVLTKDVFDVKGDSAISDTQDLIRKETDLRQTYELNQIIIRDLRDRLCLLVY